MNAKCLLAQYDRIADAPDAIARLRRFILDLAVRGKLVAQDPKDDSASALLKRIASEKARLVKGREIRKQDTEPVAANEAPFALPANWAWTRIGDICSKTGSGSTPRGGQSTYHAKGVAFLRSQNVYDDGLRLDDVAYIDHATHTRMEGTAVKPNDLLLNITGGSIGRCCLVPNHFGDANISQHVAIVRVAVGGMEGFLHKLILSPYFQAFVFSEQTGAGRGGLPKNRMDRIPVAIPPLAEQHGIVAKVDELMALCDRLETARAEREATRDRLAVASLARLNAPDPATFQDDARFALEALAALTTRPDQIKQLRQTILNLAVRGKLVPQDPNDEPASDFLKRITASKRRAPRASIADDSEVAPYALPASWKWAPLDELITSGPQNGISPKPTTRDDAPKAITLTATTSGVFNPAHFKRVEANIPEDSDFWLRDGDLLFQRGNTRDYVGIAAVYEGPPRTYLFPDLIMKVRVSDLTSLRYIHLASIAPPARAYLSAKASGAQATMPKINQTTLVSLPIPVPPIAEQHRIVAKVSALMALCNQLEGSLTAGENTRRRLLDSILVETLAPRNDAVTADTARVTAHG